MLQFLKIRDFALIRELEIEFGPGLNLLTGETGSGKSIVVDALGLVLGGRSSQEMIRSRCEMAVLEAIFTLDPRETISTQLEEAGVNGEEDSLSIRREISATGRNRIFINNSVATLSLLRQIGDRLADIHGQQDHQALLDLETHRDWLDRFGGNAEIVKDLRERYAKMRELQRRIEVLGMGEQERLRKGDTLQFQLDEIRRINPKPLEIEELEREKKILANREKILALTKEAYELLYDSEPSLLSQANRLARVLRDLDAFGSDWSDHREALVEGIYKLEDLAYRVRDSAAKGDFSPERLDQVEQRLAELDRLARKYGNSVEAILSHAEQCERELEELLSSEDNAKALAQQLDSQFQAYLTRAERLSEKRRKDAARLEQEIRPEFEALSMEKMELAVQFHARESEEKRGPIPGFCGPTGIDRVEFLIAPNRGEEMRPLTRIASGGELSRLMLAIKSLCGGERGKTLVFDEIDAGIGGRVAEAVGRRLGEISQENQVLCVTHLPQIAAFADQHFSVAKQVVGSRTETSIGLLDPSQRVQELARMLGGAVITETTRRHAREMLAYSLRTRSENKKSADKQAQE